MEVKEYIPEHYLQSVNEGDSRLIELDDNGFSSYGGPSFTIFIAPPDSQYIDVVGDNTSIGDSSLGHVFIGLKGTNPESNQFESVSIGFSAGNSYLTNTDNISFDDHNKYSEASSVTIVGQGPIFHNDLNNFFNTYNSIKNNPDGNENYNLISNNCIDFVSDFLEKSGVNGIKLEETPKKNLKKIKMIAKEYKTPLIIDLNNNGVETLSYDLGVLFEFNGKLKQTGWVSPSDALLVIDKNSDGIINDSSELFGDDYLKENGCFALNGFDGLLDFDSNNDGFISNDDFYWEYLKLWRDENSDGKTQPEELLGLSEIGISSINLNYSFSDYVDENSNEHKLISEVTWIDGKKTDVVDVWFKQKEISHPEDQLVEFISLFNNEPSISLNNKLVTSMTSTFPFLISNNARLFNGII
ncbi:TPA: hypothetical protein U2M59_004389 [Providencia stuartii]|nr:hypothetical protein [Providencia stuartii]HEM8295025.1 hypothetical protein [Providencia stuartii]